MVTMPGDDKLPVGSFEGAFLPCTFWLVTAYALSGRIDDAERVLNAAEKLTTNVGLFSEAAGARDLSLLGNYPLVFSHAEYIRAVMALTAAHQRLRLPPASRFTLLSR